jgi:hypothetical protein
MTIVVIKATVNGCFAASNKISTEHVDIFGGQIEPQRHF